MMSSGIDYDVTVWSVIEEKAGHVVRELVGNTDHLTSSLLTS